MGHVEPEQDYYYDSEDFNDEDDYAPTSKKSKVKFVFFEKATKFDEISILLLTK